MTDKQRHFGLVCDGQIEIVGLCKADVEEAVQVLNNSFFVKECVTIGSELNLPEAEQGRKELRQLCRVVAKDGVSLVAKHVASNKIVSVAFNKLQFTSATPQKSFFEDFRDSDCSSPNAKCLMDYMITMDQKVDVFELYNIDCLLEIMFIGTLPEFECRGISTALCQHSIELTRELKDGIGVDVIDPALRDKRPKAVASLFTSSFSQRIGQKLRMSCLNGVPYDEFAFNGKTFAERIGPVHPLSEHYALEL